MACNNESNGKCFTFTWKIENASYYWKKVNDVLVSPSFVLDEIDGKTWCLILVLGYGDLGDSTLLLLNSFETNNQDEIGFVWELAFLASDGKVMLSSNDEDYRVKEYPGLFVAKRSELLPLETLTTRVRIWKNEGEMLENGHFAARTIIGIERRFFTWKVRNFSTLKPMKVCSYEIKSLEKGIPLMSLDLFLNDVSESGKIHFAITPRSRIIKYCTLHLSLNQASGNTVEFLKDEFRFDALGERKEFSQFLERNTLMEMKVENLPNDVLSLQCICCFASGIMTAIEEFSSNGNTFEKGERIDNCCFDKKDVLPKSEKVLSEKLNSMLEKSIHTDIKLRTKRKSYPAHKCILITWSPVFNAMFSNDMREKIRDCVDIEDMNDDTVLRLLRYIYSAEVEELEWDDAADLYEAADKYQIITLKDICSSYLKTHLCQNNACVALLLADLHHDKDLKSFVQDFILRHGKDIMNSEEWEDLMKTNLKLAAETMHLNFKV